MGELQQLRNKRDPTFSALKFTLSIKFMIFESDRKKNRGGSKHS